MTDFAQRHDLTPYRRIARSAFEEFQRSFFSLDLIAHAIFVVKATSAD